MRGTKVDVEVVDSVYMKMNGGKQPSAEWKEDTKTELSYNRGCQPLTVTVTVTIQESDSK